MRELLQFLTMAYKRIFKCVKVNFLFQDKETIEALRKEGATFSNQHHCFEGFSIFVPDEVRKDQFEFDFQFRNMADVLKGAMYQGGICVAPVFKMQFPDQVIMLVQLEHRKGSRQTFDQI